MNILPMVIVLLLILSVVTIEKFDKFKNMMIVQQEYQSFVENKERDAFNLQQNRMGQNSPHTQRQLNFRFFFDKQLREGGVEIYRQYRLITVDLIRILYSKTAFYKDLLQKRPDFVNEMLDAFIVATKKLTEVDKIRNVDDIRRIQLDDQELQDAFHKMLKGSINKIDLINDKDLKEPLKIDQDKLYFSFLNFIHDENIPINVMKAPRELLEAIYVSPEIVDEIILKRRELCKQKNPDQSQFDQFKGKQRSEITPALLDYKIACNDDIDFYD